MFNLAAKIFAIVSTVAAGAGVAYGLATGDRSGYVLMLAAAVALAAAATATVVHVAPPPFSSPVDDSGPVAVDTTNVPAASAWPLVAAIAAGVVAVGAATDRSVLMLGLIAIVLASLAWLSQAWQEHPAWTEAMTVRLNERIVLPFVLPTTVVVLVAISVVSFSRVLLAVSKTAAWVIALVVAIAVLGALAFISTRERVGTAALKTLAGFATVLLLAAGVSGAAAGEREFHHHVAEGHYTIVAHGTSFNISRLNVPPGDVIVELRNLDDVPHTFSVYQRDGGEVLFEGEEVPGETTHAYEITAPDTPGRYWFQCDLHPDQMFGTFEVIAEVGGAAGDDTPEGTSEH